jgi:predicted lysophospholipase L1 biosynthesis ABC-type transport system permease subunit
VRASGDMLALEAAANQLAQQYFPDDVVPVRREPSYFAGNYADDLRLAKLLGMACAIAMLMAAFSIYVLATYSLQRLAKQIVLRKLYGAKRRNIAALVGREFIVLIGIGALIGLPFAAIEIQNYLATFVEHAPIGAWTLLFALILALLVTLLSTLRHTMIAMRLAPAQILRD